MKALLIFIALAYWIIGEASAAPSCPASAMPAFTANQAVQLCKIADSGILNVQQFGAAPNDGIDDTAAIQRAINAIANQYDTTELRFYYNNRVVYFPPGHYDVTGSLTIPQNVEQIRGDGAILQQHTDTADTFTSIQFSQLSISGLKFIGGRHALKITNNNLDAARVNIKNCEFSNTHDYSIFLYNSASSLLTVEQSRFYGVSKVLHTNSDWARFEDSWVTIHGAPDGNLVWINRSTDTDSLCNDTTKLAGGVFCNGAGGTLTIENLLGIPNIVGNRNQRPRWIDNLGSLYANHARFGGETGGMPVVYDYGSDPIDGSVGRVISIQNSQVCGGAAGGQVDGTDTNDSAVLNLRTSLPRTIILNGNNCIIDNPYIRGGATTINLVAFLAAIQAANPPAERFFKIITEPNNYAIGNEQYTVPTALVPLIRQYYQVIK